MARGLGPPRQSGALPLADVINLALPTDPAVPYGPAGIGNLIAASSFFCLREIETSLALQSHVNPHL